MVNSLPLKFTHRMQLLSFLYPGPNQLYNWEILKNKIVLVYTKKRAEWYFILSPWTYFRASMMKQKQKRDSGPSLEWHSFLSLWICFRVFTLEGTHFPLTPIKNETLKQVMSPWTRFRVYSFWGNTFPSILLLKE